MFVLFEVYVSWIFRNRVKRESRDAASIPILIFAPSISAENFPFLVSHIRLLLMSRRSSLGRYLCCGADTQKRGLMGRLERKVQGQKRMSRFQVEITVLGFCWYLVPVDELLALSC